MLVEAGCDVNSGNFEKKPAIFIARYDILQYLLSLPATKVNVVHYQTPEEFVSDHGHTALMSFIEKGHDKTKEISLLIQKRADLKFKDANGRTPLLYFCLNYDDPNLTQQDFTKIIQMFIDHGANILARDRFGGNVFSLAGSCVPLLKALIDIIKRNHPNELVDMLNASVYREDHYRAPPLIALARRLMSFKQFATQFPQHIPNGQPQETDYIESMQLLIDNGSNVTLPDTRKETIKTILDKETYNKLTT